MSSAGKHNLNVKCRSANVLITDRMKALFCLLTSPANMVVVINIMGLLLLKDARLYEGVVLDAGSL